MPRRRMPGGSYGHCPQCGDNLISIIVLHGGRREHCPTCGFSRIIEPEPPPGFPLEEETEPTGLQDTVQLLAYAEAVLQTVRQVHGCRRCRERLVLLRAQVDDLEQTRTEYSVHPERCDDDLLDAFFDQLTDRLQGISDLCNTCRHRMERTTWELFVGLLLETQAHDE